MQTVETVLVFAGIPVAVIAAVTGLVYAASARPGRRYRPGRPFDFTPAWFIASSGAGSATRPAAEAVSGAPARAAVGARPASGRPETTAPPTADADPAPAAQWPPSDPEQGRATGGASDRW